MQDSILQGGQLAVAPLVLVMIVSGAVWVALATALAVRAVGFGALRNDQARARDAGALAFT